MHAFVAMALMMMVVMVLVIVDSAGALQMMAEIMTVCVDSVLVVVAAIRLNRKPWPPKPPRERQAYLKKHLGRHTQTPNPKP